MKINLVAILLIVIISFLVIWSIRPNGLKKEVSETINKSLSEIGNKTTKPSPTAIENATNIIKVKEIEKTLDEIETNIPIIDREVIAEQLVSQDYAEVVIRVTDKEKIDKILQMFTTEEFKVRGIFRTYPPYSIHGNITLSGLGRLKDNPDIERISIIHYFGIKLNSSLSLIGVDDVWKLKANNINITGNNITVCVVDSGVNYTHPDLGGCPQTNNINTANCSKVIGGYNTVGLLHDNNPMDDNGHGTHVAGITTANGSIRGAAPDSNITAVKVLNQNGIGDEVDIREGIEWCINNRVTYNIKIISISIGNEINYTSYCDGVDDVVTAANSAGEYGIFVAVASGNSGNISGINSPACGSNVTSVGATTKTDSIASYSNRNNITDLFAPGSSINSTGLPYNSDCIAGNRYQICSGTSMSTPHVAGVAALMKQANSSLTPPEIENLLKKTSRPVYDQVTGLTFRRIVAYKAVLASYNNLVTSELSELYSNGGNKTFEFKIFNALNTTTTDVNWTVNFGDGNIVTINKNITLQHYNETFVYVQHYYSGAGNFTLTAYANATQKTSNWETLNVEVRKPNLKITNITAINSTGTYRVFEFFIENTGSLNQTNIYWRLNVTNNQNNVSSTKPITLNTNEAIFVDVEYQYSTLGSYTINVTVDTNNQIDESNETDNSKTLLD